MGLDAFLRKIPKSRLSREVRERITSEKVGFILPANIGQYSLSNEIGYWRGNWGLNNFIYEMAAEKVGAHRLSRPLYNGASVLLDEGDLLAIQTEMVFGDGLGLEWDTEVIARAQRILKCNRSFVYYYSSW
jgi:hypothetical protein